MIQLLVLYVQIASSVKENKLIKNAWSNQFQNVQNVFEMSP
jgi:hypothetical protein